MRYIVLLLASCLMRAGQSSSGAGVPPEVKPENKCTIEGTVLNGATGEPVKKANISLRSFNNSNSPPGAVSDASGHFKIENLDPGRYIMMAVRNGFVMQQYGAKGTSQGGTPLTLTAGQTIKDAVFKLTPQGVITGRVVDEDGDPVAHAMLQCQRYVYNRGKKQLASTGAANTDDLGEYRIFGLAPGRYYVTAFHQAAEAQGQAASGDLKKNYEEGYAPVYYPNALTAEAAAPLQVTPGAQLRGIDLRLIKTRTVRLRGHVTSSLTNKSLRANVSLINRESMIMGMNNGFGRGVDEKGNFEIQNVMPGSYFLMARVFEANKQSVAKVPLEVGSTNLDGLQISVNPPVDVTGHVVVEDATGGNAGSSLAGINVMLQSRLPGPFGGGGNGQVAPDGTFKIANVVTDTYTVAVFGFRDSSYLKSVRLGDVDVTDTGLDFTQSVTPGELTVVLSPAGGQLEGTVQNDKSEPASGALVVLIPDAEKRTNQRLYKTASTDQAGKFAMKGITPGEYKLFAWEQAEFGAYQDPDFLKPYEGKGEAVSIKENGHDSKQLKLIPAEEPR